MRALISTGLVAGLCVLSAPSVPEAREGFRFASTYDVSGVNLDGTRYSGTAQIQVVSDTTFTVRWRTGGTTSEGVGMLWDDTLAVAYSLQNSVGVVMYRIREGGRLEGIWTVGGQNGAGRETLTPRR